MKKLSRSRNGVIIVKPRWPYRFVHISERTYEKLISAQRDLSKHDIKIILTRGFENEGRTLAALHFIARCIGCFVFCFIFPWRALEAKNIFSANGHTDINRNCTDVSLAYRGQALNLLPLGVFTPRRQVAALYRRHQLVLDTVREVLQTCGFSVHPNPTEALQIHCEC